jgi:hypothetical protein
MRNVVKIRSAGTELFHADGQINMTKPIDGFRNFARVPKRGMDTRGCSS